MGHLVALACVAGYAFSCLFCVWRSSRGTTGSAIVNYPSLDLLWKVVLIGFFCHSFSLWFYVIRGGVVGVNATYLMWLSWALALLFLLLWRKFFDPLFGALTLPLVLGLFCGSSVVAHSPQGILFSQNEGLSSVMTIGHVAPVVVAEACLLGVLVMSFALLIQERRLKRKASLVHFLSGPSMVLLQRINNRVVEVGFAAISFGILVALIWTFLQGDGFPAPDLLQASGYATWGCFAIMLVLCSRSNFSQRQLALMYCAITCSAILGLFSAHSWFGLPLHQAAANGGIRFQVLQNVEAPL
jgi:hypothetical protein